MYLRTPAKNTSLALGEDTTCPVDTFDTTQRTSFSRGGAEIFGWPSTGGVLYKDDVDPVVLNFLGEDRFSKSVRSPSAAEEDRFCQQLRRIGAMWYSSWSEWVDVIVWRRRSEGSEQNQHLVFGWPDDGGVWMLNFGSQEEMPEDFGRIHMALTMEERCRVMEDYGAVYFDNPKDCRYLEDTLA